MSKSASANFGEGDALSTRSRSNSSRTRRGRESTNRLRRRLEALSDSHASSVFAAHTATQGDVRSSDPLTELPSRNAIARSAADCARTIAGVSEHIGPESRYEIHLPAERIGDEQCAPTLFDRERRSRGVLKLLERALPARSVRSTSAGRIGKVLPAARQHHSKQLRDDWPQQNATIQTAKNTDTARRSVVDTRRGPGDNICRGGPVSQQRDALPSAATIVISRYIRVPEWSSRAPRTPMQFLHT